MRKNITIGERTIELECNLGTASFFQEFVKKNIFSCSSDIASKMAAAAKVIKSAGITQESSKADIAAEASQALDDLSMAKAEAVDVAAKLIYIMSLQAQSGKTKEDISKIRSLLTDDDYLLWSMDISPELITFDTYKEVMDFWKAQTTKTSQSKN